MNIEQLIIEEFEKRGLKIDIVYKLCDLYNNDKLDDNKLIEMITDMKVIGVNYSFFSKLQNELINSNNKDEFKNILKKLINYEMIYKRYYEEFNNNPNIKNNLHLGYSLLN